MYNLRVCSEEDNRMRNCSIRFLFLTLVSLNLLVNLDVIQAQELTGREVYASRLRGLDLNNVGVSLHMPVNEFYYDLSDRALKRFQQAGISFKTIMMQPDDDLLILTLHPHPVGGCEDKYLYDLKLEIWEWVVTERTPRHHVWGLTYRLGEQPSIVNGARVVLQNLEKDIDELIDDFLVEYEHANRSNMR